MPVCKKVNKDFFKKWSYEMVYVLGFFMADGSIDVNPRGSHYLSIQICDKNLLYAIRDALGSEHKISIRKGVGNENNRYRIQIGSKEMFNDLKKLGVSEQKAYTMAVPNIPQKYFSDFVRGYFDGDGHVWTGFVHKERKTLTYTIQLGFTSCSGKFLVGLQKRLLKYGLSMGSLCFTNRAYRLQYSVNDSLLLYSIMYDNLESILFLSRKKDRFDSFLQTRNKYMRP